jgi:hypothetical protein
MESRIAAVEAAVAAKSADAVVAAVEALIDPSSPGHNNALVRSTLRKLAASLEALPVGDNEFIDSAASRAVEKLRPQLLSLEDADFQLRLLLSKLYSGEEDYVRAGVVLGAAHIDSPQVLISDAERASAYIRVAQAYLKGDDDVNADRFINRATHYALAPGVPPGIKATYSACWCQVLDFRRKFLEAALRYGDLSRLSEEHNFLAADLLVLLEKGARCIVLAPAGPSKQRIMGTFMRDERIGSIDVRKGEEGAAACALPGPCRCLRAPAAGPHTACCFLSLPLLPLLPLLFLLPLLPAARAAQDSVHAAAHVH